MPKLNQQTQLKLIETELRNALRSVTEHPHGEPWFMTEILIGHIETALKAATELKADIESQTPAIDLEDHLKTLEPPEAG